MRITRLRRTNPKLLDYLRKNFKFDAVNVPQTINATKIINKEAMFERIRSINNWYTKIIGLDEVRLYQDRVANLQERLLVAQEKRRDLGQHLAEIRKKSNDLQEQIHKVKRQENLQKFLDLMKEETEVLKLEEEISRAFQECDREEREIFTAFTNAVRDSHEKQRAQLEYTKYFGIILSIIGSLLTFCYSTVKKHDLKRCIEENIAKVNRSALSQLENDAVLVNIVSKGSEPLLMKIAGIENEIRQIRDNLGSKSEVKILNDAPVPRDEGERRIRPTEVILFSFAVAGAFSVLRSLLT